MRLLLLLEAIKDLTINQNSLTYFVVLSSYPNESPIPLSILYQCGEDWALNKQLTILIC